MQEIAFYIIAERGKANKILKALQANGIEGGTIVHAEGSVPSSWLDSLGLSRKHKELLMFITNIENEDMIFNLLDNEFNFTRKNTGVAFSMPIISHWNKRIEYGHMDYKEYCISVIVEEGNSSKTVKAATKSGASGATVVSGRGAGVPEENSKFNLVFEPEKDIIIIIANSEKVDQIIDGISKDLKIEKPGAGFIFTWPIRKSIGMEKQGG